MTHVVAEPCFNCKYTDCVVVCPVECFYELELMLVINPDECIDCEACVPECRSRRSSTKTTCRNSGPPTQLSTKICAAKT